MSGKEVDEVPRMPRAVIERLTQFLDETTVFLSFSSTVFVDVAFESNSKL